MRVPLSCHNGNKSSNESVVALAAHCKHGNLPVCTLTAHASPLPHVAFASRVTCLSAHWLCMSGTLPMSPLSRAPAILPSLHLPHVAIVSAAMLQSSPSLRVGICSSLHSLRNGLHNHCAPSPFKDMADGGHVLNNCATSNFKDATCQFTNDSATHVAGKTDGLHDHHATSPFKDMADGGYILNNCAASHFKDATCQFAKDSAARAAGTTNGWQDPCKASPFKDSHAAGKTNVFCSGEDMQEESCRGKMGYSEEDSCEASFCHTRSSWQHHKGMDCDASSHHIGELETDQSPGASSLCSTSSSALMLGQIPALTERGLFCIFGGQHKMCSVIE